MFISYISDFALNDYYLALCRAISAFWLLFQCHPGHPNWTRNQACLFNASALHMKIKKSWISRLFFLSNTLIQKDVDCRDILSGVGLKSRSFCLQYGRNLSTLHIFLRLSSSTRSENALVYWSTPVWDSCFHWIVATFGYGSIPIPTIFSGMNIHLPAILMFTRGVQGFDPLPFVQSNGLRQGFAHGLVTHIASTGLASGWLPHCCCWVWPTQWGEMDNLSTVVESCYMLPWSKDG